MASCKSNLNSFCYVCGHYKAANANRRADAYVSDEFKQLYRTYFDRPFATDNWYAPKGPCKTCYNTLLDWKRTEGKKQMNFGVPMVWKEPKEKKHVPSNCYACANFAMAFANKNKTRKHKYESVESVEMPKPHSATVPLKYPSQSAAAAKAAKNSEAKDPEAKEPAAEESEEEVHSDSTEEPMYGDEFTDDSLSISDDDEKDPSYDPGPSGSSNEPQPLTQADLDFISTKLKFTKRQNAFFYSFLKQHRCLAEQWPKKDARPNDGSKRPRT